MEKIAWITDSTCYLEPELIEKYNIHIVPLSVVFGDESFKEGEEITSAQFYEKLKASNELPKTSQPSVGDFETLFTKLAKDYDRAIAVHLSSGISGTLATCQSAQQSTGFPVEIIDSEIADYPISFILLEGIRLQEEGRSYEEIVEHMKTMVHKIKAFFLVDDLGHLHRGGRLNAAQFLMGSMLQIKPILHLKEKKIVPFEKIRTYRKAKNRIYDLFHEDAQKGMPLKVRIIHGNILPEAEAWKKELEEKYPHVLIEISMFGPVIGTHVGPGTMGLAWYEMG